MSDKEPPRSHSPRIQQALQILSLIRDSGLALVPMEADAVMQEAGRAAGAPTAQQAADIWCAMRAAAARSAAHEDMVLLQLAEKTARN